MQAAAAMGRGGRLRAAAARCVRAPRFSTNGGGPATPGGGEARNASGGVGATKGSGAEIGKATGGRAPTNGGAATGGGATIDGTATGGSATKGVGAPTGGVRGSGECSSLSQLRTEIFEETGRISDNYSRLSKVDTALFEEIARVEEEMGSNYKNWKKELVSTTCKMVGAAGIFGFTFGVWMSPYLQGRIVNDSVKEVERRARLTKVDALLTEAGSERGAAGLGADGAGCGEKISALAPPAAAKGDRATAGAAAAKCSSSE